MVKPLYRAPAILLSCLALSFAAAGLGAAEFYVSPTGTAGGSGSIGSPWNLQTALNQPGAVHAGDTIWMRGGTYTGTYVSYLNGTSSNPIIVRQYTGERAKLDGGANTTATLTVNGSYTWFWGFEVMSSDTRRQSSQTGDWPTDIYRGDGVASGSASSPGIKLINLTVHDTRQGISVFSTWYNSEVYGCLIYYSGWQAPDHANGHGIYTQNQTGFKKFVDNIVFQQFSHGLHAYTENGYLQNFTVDGNTFFNNGKLATIGSGRNLLLGGQVVTSNPVVTNNAMYYANGTGPQSAFYVGYMAGCTNAVVNNNYSANNTYFPHCDPVTMTGNSFYGAISGFTQGQYPSNTYYSSRPTGQKVLVRPNQYEAGRANITVYNWSGAATAAVDLSGVLSPGTGYEIRNAQDFFGAPVLTGTYSGGTVSVPVGALSVAAPVGWASPPPSGPEFNAFVVLPASPAGTPTPTPVWTATRTPTRTPTSGGPTSTPTRTPTPGAGALPAPWQQKDIGPVGVAGNATYSAGTFNVSASGWDIEETSDEFRYVYQPWTGDGTVVARVTSIQNTNPWAKGGVMIRESLNANSAHAMTVLTPGNGIAFQRRKTTGGSTTPTGGPSVAAPYWVKIVRSGSTFTSYSSSDGSAWTLVGSDTITMGANVFVGLALTSHNHSVLCAAVMTNVSATGGAAPTPTRTPTPGGSTVLRLEAEGPVVSAPLTAVSDASAFGGQYIVTAVTNSGTAAWTFSVPTTGTYYVWGRVKAINPQQDSFFVKMDSGSEDVFDVAEGTWSPNWQWKRLNGRGSSGAPLAINPRTFSLSAGSHTLTFRGRETLTQLDRVIVTNDPAFVATEVP